MMLELGKNEVEQPIQSAEVAICQKREKAKPEKYRNMR